MTSVNIGTGSSLPSDCNTLTKIALWVADRIETVQPAREFNIFENQLPSRHVDLRAFRTRDFGHRASVLIILPLATDWKTSSGKFWEKVLAITIDGNSPGGASQAFTPGTGGNIPTTVTNLARLACWVGEALARCNPTLEIRENDAPNINGFFETTPAASSSVGNVPDIGWVNLIRLSIPINSAWRSTSGVFYNTALNLSNTALPSDLLT